jgi:hypothetical protein
MMVVTWKEVVLQDKEMSTLSTRWSREKKWRSSRKQIEKKSTCS